MESHNGLPGVSRNTAIVKEEPNEIIVVDPLGSIDFTDSELNLSSAVENELAVTYVEGRARRVISSEVDIKIEPGMLSTVEDPEAAYSSHSFELDSDSNILDDGESDVNSCTEGVLTSDQVELMMKREPHSNLKVPTSAASSLRKQLVSMSQSNSSIGENPSFLRKGLKRHSGPGAQSFSLSNSYLFRQFTMNDEKLIELVREQPILYDTTQKGYTNINLKANVWDAIAAKCDFQSGDEAKNMWLKLRDAYRSSLKRLETRSCDEGFPSKSAKWKFSDQMSFLKPYMKDRKRHTTDTNVIVPIVEIRDVSNSAAYTLQGVADFGSESQVFLELSATTSTQSTKKASKMESMMTSLNKQREERQKSRDELRPQLFQQPDALKLFFDSMYESTKKLSPSLQKQVKRKLFAIVSEAEDSMESLNQQTTSTNTPPLLSSPNNFP